MIDAICLFGNNLCSRTMCEDADEVKVYYRAFRDKDRVLNIAEYSCKTAISVFGDFKTQLSAGTVVEKFIPTLDMLSNFFSMVMSMGNKAKSFLNIGWSFIVLVCCCIAVFVFASTVAIFAATSATMYAISWFASKIYSLVQWVLFYTGQSFLLNFMKTPFKQAAQTITVTSPESITYSEDSENIHEHATCFGFIAAGLSKAGKYVKDGISKITGLLDNRRLTWVAQKVKLLNNAVFNFIYCTSQITVNFDVYVNTSLLHADAVQKLCEEKYQTFPISLNRKTLCPILNMSPQTLFNRLSEQGGVQHYSKIISDFDSLTAEETRALCFLLTQTNELLHRVEVTGVANIEWRREIRSGISQLISLVQQKGFSKQFTTQLIIQDPEKVTGEPNSTSALFFVGVSGVTGTMLMLGSPLAAGIGMTAFVCVGLFAIRVTYTSCVNEMCHSVVTPAGERDACFQNCWDTHVGVERRIKEIFRPAAQFASKDGEQLIVNLYGYISPLLKLILNLARISPQSSSERDPNGMVPLSLDVVNAVKDLVNTEQLKVTEEPTRKRTRDDDDSPTASRQTPSFNFNQAGKRSRV